ncbi:hypothetical protein [Virgibacillus halodenitrificans]|uniref:hypothetical protein n=1 Tax=Virgibacillus halodenitrificans TaxID=1482 RepID=UPI001F211438|nr:hypothetical protein [Virgibacillus halodenitrificans]
MRTRGWRQSYVSAGDDINRLEKGLSAAEWEYPPEKGLIGWRAEVSAREDINQLESGNILRRRY